MPSPAKVRLSNLKNLSKSLCSYVFVTALLGLLIPTLIFTTSAATAATKKPTGHTKDQTNGPIKSQTKGKTKGASKRNELKDVQGRLQHLQKEVGQAEEARADVAEELRETERTISETSRKLHALADERAEAESELDSLTAQSKRLEQTVGTQQTQLEQLLYRQYTHAEAGTLAGQLSADASKQDALKLLISGNDPNQLARDAHYLTLLSQAKASLIHTLGEALNEKQRLTVQANTKNNELVEIEKRQQRERADLVGQQKKRQVLLAQISGKIKTQRQEIDKLKLDEKRLAKVIENLARSPVKQTSKPRHGRKTSGGVSENAGKVGKDGQEGGGSSAQATQPNLKNEQTPEDIEAGIAFAQLKGRLRLPTRGEITNRFGAPRQEGGATWKGLFIRAASGGEVKAIAPGKVVFADSLRGFGNLIIIDHGGGYLSVYGNNESVLKTVGQATKAGEAIASIGNSGGNPETGLYFELRHLGQAQDPLKWVSLK